jgi:hypothetical protein
MTAPALPLTAEAQAALTEFLRGIERRAAVFAELACGSSQRGDATVEATLHAFCRVAARAPLADWDSCFWGLLLASPELRRDRGEGRWPAPWTRLAELGPGLRLALLLRLVAGLDDAQVAAIVGIAPATQVLAVQRALGEGRAPTQSPRWQAWVLASRQQLRMLGGDRLVRLARARERALHGHAPPMPPMHPRRMPLLWAAIATCVLAFAATFLPHTTGRDATPVIRTTALPPAEPPLARFDADTALLTHRDFDQLSASPGQQSLARGLAFYAWYAAQSSDGATPPDNAVPAITEVGGTHASD